ncbi:MAG: T9SS type A sorting domain-containing protein [Muribaculaceae bacterium]|nr:T9SS type A sorting domain-containing protein [Muribaculaceae bacterium]
MIRKQLFLTLAAFFLAVLATTAQQASNRLVIPDVSTPASSAFQLPVQLENSEQVVAAQFTLTVPNGVTLNPSSITRTQRADGHEVTMRKMSPNTYMVMIYSPSNAAIAGRTGTLLTIEGSVGDLDDNTAYPMQLTDLVLSDVHGNEISSSGEAGSIVIVTHCADLTVTAVNLDKTTLAPDEQVGISWTVSNIGNLDTGGGWSESLTLVAANGATKHLTRITYDSSLAAGQQVNRTANVQLPHILGLDGNATVRVQVIPNTDTQEPPSKQGNNTAQSGEITVSKKLSLQLSPDIAPEVSGNVVKGLLTRSGDWSQKQVFALTHTTDERVSMADEVTIQAGKSSEYFYLTLSANNTHDPNNSVVVEAKGGGYAPASDTLEIVDDVFPALYIESSKRDIDEGESFVLHVHLDQAPQHDVTLNLNCDNASLFRFPSQVTLPAGQKAIYIDVTSIDDDVPHLNLTATFLVSATGYVNSEAYVGVADNDIPEIELTLTPTTVSEGAGLMAINARLHRMGDANSKITIKLSDDSEGDIYYPTKSMTLEKGVDTAEFTLGVVDNAQVDGDRTVNITAAVYISSCSCQATGNEHGAVTVPVTIIDNDGPSLTLASTLSTVLEGGTTVVTVTRNTGTANALTVTLSSNADEALDYAHTVTIPAGQASAEVTIAVRSNTVAGDSRVVELAANADGFAVGTTWFLVSDQTLPDAAVRSLTIAESEIYVGDEVTLNLTLANEGASPLPSQTLLAIYVDQAAQASAEIRLADELAVGSEVSLTRTIALPPVPGDHTIKVVANPARAFSELNYTNNEAVAHIEVLPQFAVSVTADQQAYAPGATVTFTGRATGKLIGNQEIEIYVINNGLRQTITAVTDATGNLTATWTPEPNQMGHFVAGACYPGENTKEAQTEFDVYELALADRYQTVQMTVGEPITGTITVQNNGNLPQSGVTAAVKQGAENIEAQFSTISNLTGGEHSAISFTLNATSPTDNKATNLYNGWQEIVLQITDEQGAAADYRLYCYAAMPTAKLEPSLTQIKTTVTQGGTHDIEFTLHNVGRGASGAIELSLPPYITSLTPATLPSLDFDESATVVLRFGAPEGMQLSQIMKGTLGINCAGGTGLSLPFEFELVSEAVGTLIVDVTDEYTYYTDEAPHVAGATVTIQHPVTSAIIAQGVTDTDGHFTVELNEGYYNVVVTEPSHDSANRIVLIDPGREKTETILISLSGVEITYEIVETEVEDVYDIKTTFNFETNVPIPVVTVEMPSSIDGESLAAGESLMFDILITNHGLITAEDVELTLYEHPLFTFTAMETGKFNLAANQSKIIKVVMTCTETEMNGAKRAATDSKCYWATDIRYSYKCDKITRKYVRIETPVRVKTCPTGGKDLREWQPRDPIGGPNIPPISVPSWLAKFSDWMLKGGDGDISCNPCTNEYLKRLVFCGINVGLSITGIGQIRQSIKVAYALASCIENIRDVVNRPYDERTVITNVMSCAWSIGLSFMEGTPIGALIGCLIDLLRPCNAEQNSPMHKASSNYSDNSSIAEFQKDVELCYQAILSLQNVQNTWFGNDCWLNCSPDQFDQFMTEFSSSFDDEMTIPQDKVASLLEKRPDNINIEQARQLVERWNNTILYYKGESDAENHIDLEALATEIENAAAIQDEVIRRGYDDISSLYLASYEKVTKALTEESSNSVCSTISLEFKQTMTLTRQGFLGTLTVKNNHESNAIEDFQLHLTVTDPEGNMAGADKMEIHTKSLNGFTGDLQLGSDWNLTSGTTGVATVEYIPTDKAALEHDLDYTFGGTVTFVDPYTGLTVSRELTPKKLTVRPAPQLYLDYFMQRDVLGDDPLTADVVEPSIPTEFALLINNRGAGDANNVKITTAQPQITENDKGLLIDMALLNGKDASMMMEENYVNDFGTIAAGDHALAQWWLLSSLLGHFTSYDVQVNHVTGFNNPNLSLVKDARVHELIHECVDTSNQVAFLVNEDIDADDTPDHLFFLDGETASVAAGATLQATRQGETQLMLTLSGAAAGWNYAQAIDPTLGMVNIVDVKRQSDGAEVPLGNVWLTDRTLRDGKDPLYENRIHIVDQLATGSNETYIITVSPIAQPILAVEAIDGMKTTAMNLQAVTTATVRFNKAIDATTFTSADITLLREGEKLDANQIAITPIDEQTFALDLSALTTQNGYYVLTVHTIGITDAEGYPGTNGKMVGWSQRVEGTVAYKVYANPAEGGEVSSLAGELPAGSELKLTATPASGYSFAGWYVDDKLVSNEPSWKFTLDAVLTIIEARFQQMVFDVAVNVEPNEGGHVEGNGNGKYAYGDVLRLTATPAKYHEFAGWTVNGKNAGNEPNLELSVTENVVIAAHFDAIERVTIDYALKAGWNWVSFGVEDESMADLNDALGTLYNARTLRGQNAEATHTGLWKGALTELSPEQAYKLQMITDGTYALTGEPITNHTLTLKPGWNWMGYLPTDELGVTEALARVPAEAGDVLKGQDAFVLFDGEQWLGDLTTMKPGLGYMYYSKSTKSFSFPTQHMASRSYVKAHSEQGKTAAPWTYDPYKYANNMAVNAVISKLTLSEGSWIGAFVGDECRGAAPVTNGVFYLTVHGDNDGEELTFKLYDPTLGGMNLSPNDNMTFAENNHPVVNEPIVMTAIQTGVQDVQGHGNFKVYPVPVTDRLYLAGATCVDWLVIHGVSGRQMMKITNADVSGGIDVSQLANGMYVITINAENRQWSSVFIKE